MAVSAFDIVRFIWEIILGLWWLWLFFILTPLATNAWRAWRQEEFKHSSEFKGVMLELKIPREIRKSPRAMEQVLMAIHSLRNAAGHLREIWWDGEVTKWYALEMVSFGGEVHFYVKVPYYKQKSLVEAAFYSYYPDVEVVEVDDYVDQIPRDLKELEKTGYDAWGTEMVITREAAFPIKSYLDFESPDEDKQYDPISAFLEILGKIKKEERVGIQMLIAPAAPQWRNQFDKVVEGMRVRKDKNAVKRLKTKTTFDGGPLPAFEIAGGDSADDAAKALSKALMQRTPGETDVLKAVENNLSKPAFDVVIRFIYLSPKTLYYDSFARRGLVGAFNQYAALDMNSFQQNFAVSTRTQIWNWPYVFPKKRNRYRKQRLLRAYRGREMPAETLIGKLLHCHPFGFADLKSKRFLMSTESLATLFHPPTFIVLTAPHIRRVESRKVGPPAGLGIFGEEKEIEKFQ